MTTDEVNAEIIEFWNQRAVQEQAERYMPAVYPPFNGEALLCVGFNPSMPQNRPGFIEKHFPELQYPAFFEWSNRDDFVHQMWNADQPGTTLQIEQCAKEGYSFYKKFGAIAQELHTRWDHVDLFFCREVNQRGLQSRIFDNVRNQELNDFGNQQLKLAMELVVDARPRMILVANAEAARIFERAFKLDFDSEHCCYQGNIGRRNVPVFLSSMLTGSRALDNFSYRTLRCLMKKEWNRRYFGYAH